MNAKDLMMEMSALTAVSGREEAMVRYLEEKLAPLGPVERLANHSVACRIAPVREGRPHLMLDAHLDEIGMMVTYLEEEGFLRVGACGGIDRRLLMASQVTVHAAGGDYPGVIASIPPHLQKGEDASQVPEMDDILVDVGYTGQRLRELFAPGDLVTLDHKTLQLQNGRLASKALDDRAGCAAILLAAERFAALVPDYGVTAVFSSMEELGSQGARTAAYAVNPTHAVTVDVSFGVAPGVSRREAGEIGAGPMIGISPILDHALTSRLIALAQREGIPFQREVMAGNTSTNADVIATTRGGVKTALVSIPQRNMHTPVEVMLPQDVEDTARLIALLAKEELA